MRRKRKWNDPPRMVRVIRDVRDGRRDYWLPEDVARNYYLSGRFSLISVYATGVDYYDEEAIRC